jgi:hypothetical protein
LREKELLSWAFSNVALLQNCCKKVLSIGERSVKRKKQNTTSLLALERKTYLVDLGVESFERPLKLLFA